MLTRLSILGFLTCAILAGPVMAEEPQNRPQTEFPGVRPLPPAEFDETLAVGGDDIEAAKLQSRMTVEVMVDGTGPHRFIVDSGADTSVIGEGLARKLELTKAAPALLHAMTEVREVERVNVPSLTLGPSSFEDMTLPVLKERHIGADGMIGLDALVEQRLMLDFEERVITVEDSYTKPQISGRDAIVVVGRLQRGQLILTDVEAQREKVEAVIDTGTEVTIGNRLLRDALVRRWGRDPQKLKIYGVTGAAAEIEFAVISRLKLGPVLFRDVTIAFADVPPFEFFGINDKPSLLLGTDLMESFRRVSLDFRKRKVRFELSRCAARIVRLRTTTRVGRLSADRPSACQQ